MKRTQLANKKNRTNNEEDRIIFNRHKNYVKRLCKKAKKEYYSSLDVKKLDDTKKFWKTFKPNISDKSKSTNKITLVKGTDIISKDEDVANEFSDIFSNAVNKLDIPSIPLNEIPADCVDIVDIAVMKYREHPSIIKIKKSAQD